MLSVEQRTGSTSGASVFRRTSLEAKADAILDSLGNNPINNPNSTHSKLGRRALLLTGASGQFGRRFLEHFLTLPSNRTPQKIFCIIRNSTQAFLSKIVSKFNAQAQEMFPLRVTILTCSDLSDLNLGLSEEDYKSIKEEVDHVVHAAGNVSVGVSYVNIHAFCCF
jgi:FlaA1/EpsC-like NDP-sugar epimerase